MPSALTAISDDLLRVLGTSMKTAFSKEDPIQSLLDEFTEQVARLNRTIDDSTWSGVQEIGKDMQHLTVAFKSHANGRCFVSIEG